MGHGFWGGFPPAALAIPAAVVPEGGLPFWLPVAPAFSFVFAPIPPTPFPGGEGGDQSYFMQGASPLASPRLSPGGTYRTSQAGARRGAVSCRACFACRINAFLPPIPPARARRALFPGGEGGDQSCFLQGAPPLASLRLSPGGTYRTRQAGARRGAVSCRACFACRINAFLPPIPPTPFPGGEGGDQSYFLQGASPLASPGLNLRFAAKTTGSGSL